MIIRTTARAQADIDLASEELTDAYGVRVADTFQQRLAETLRRLERFPSAAGRVDPPYPKYPDMRVRQVRKFPYCVVYYIPIPGGIRVVRVLHAGQDADAIFG